MASFLPHHPMNYIQLCPITTPSGGSSWCPQSRLYQENLRIPIVFTGIGGTLSSQCLTWSPACLNNDTWVLGLIASSVETALHLLPQMPVMVGGWEVTILLFHSYLCLLDPSQANPLPSPHATSLTRPVKKYQTN